MHSNCNRSGVVGTDETQRDTPLKPSAMTRLQLQLRAVPHAL